jgi:hypothetical protein
MTRFLLLTLCSLCLCGQSAAQSFLLFSRDEARAMKTALTGKDARFAAAATQLRKDAEARMKDGPWSVTFHRPEGRKLDPHDYYSEGPYYWPDPANPKGPYIHKDGETNRGRFSANHDDLGRLGQAVFLLGSAGWLLDEPRYSDRAAQLLAVWCVDPATRMNPNLEHGQAVVGVNDGRGIGIIDTTSLIWAVQGMVFLDATGRWKASERDAVRAWMAAYLEWLTHSKKGLDEKNNGNNHSSWWAGQVASLAIFTGDAASQEMVWRFYRESLIPSQMLADGSCPREESRTKSLGYSAFNLEALSVVCRLAQQQRVDLWRFRAPNGAGMEAGIAYLAPFVVHPEKWEKKQIEPFRNDRTYFLALAGLGLGSAEDLSTWKAVRAPGPFLHQLLDLLLAVKNK